MLMSRGSGECGVLLFGLVELLSVKKSVIFCPFLDVFLSMEAFLMLVLMPKAALGKEDKGAESKSVSENGDFVLIIGRII